MKNRISLLLWFICGFVAAISSSYVSCQCRPGYVGNGFGPQGCQISGDGGRSIVPLDPCNPNPCQSGGTCSNTPNGFQCSCPSGYAGNDFSYSHWISTLLNLIEWLMFQSGITCGVALDPCMSSPCRNGATCALVGPNQQYRCICPAGFTGDTCQNELEGNNTKSNHSSVLLLNSDRCIIQCSLRRPYGGIERNDCLPCQWRQSGVRPRGELSMILLEFVAAGINFWSFTGELRVEY